MRSSSDAPGGLSGATYEILASLPQTLDTPRSGHSFPGVGSHPLHPARIRMTARQSGDRPSRGRLSRIADRHETGVALLVAAWTAAFVLRSRLADVGRLSETVNEALLSLLFVIPIILIGWGVLAVADRRFKLGLFTQGDGR